MDHEQLVGTLGGFTIFADLSRPELEAMVLAFEEEWVPEGHRIVRQGLSGSGFYVILEGEASVRIDGTERAKLSRGDFFGELSVLLDEPPVADVVALSPVRALVMSRTDLADILRSAPTMMLRMLQVTLRRLRSASEWRP